MPGTHVERLVEQLTRGDEDGAMADELRRWLAESRRLRAFVERHRDKLRKKLRSAREPGARLDVRAEILVARALLADRRMELGWETSGSAAGGPDFQLVYRDHVALNLEVTRWRGDPAALERQVATKLRQLPPSAANALILVGPRESPVDLDDVLGSLEERADRGDDAFFVRHGLDGVRGYRARRRRLGGVFAWPHSRATRAAQWTNPTARIPLPPDAARAIAVALQRKERG